ncbi:VOC family protein [Changpingibacter yushuensis]|uniref:VOC family protein n=1 Tax=Changpingibacter yushuensis TaxID=2758440 RepID=UPI00165D7AE6|nr:VOC family protein [Changpingibacter yushuensis]
MNITQTAISLNVADIDASASFAKTHFGYEEAMASDGFVSLQHAMAGPNLIFLATGLPTFKPSEIAGPAGQGLLLVFVVDDLDEQFNQIEKAGAHVVTPPTTEPWGERYCQFADPNGLIWQLVQWVN